MSQPYAMTSPRFVLKCMQASIDLKLYPIVGMNIQDVMIGGAPDWIAPKQRVDFSFVMDLQGKERRLPTYGVVISNDARGLDIRYRPPTSQWRDILAKLIAEESA
ncbi:MAG TPA: hypothetical protein VHE77_16870 [Dongiaceae bacterium]|jgi:hypothetical protein|nr:hypothetical protein [Dongiaceae bacterium]